MAFAAAAGGTKKWATPDVIPKDDSGRHCQRRSAIRPAYFCPIRRLLAVASADPGHNDDLSIFKPERP